MPTPSSRKAVLRGWQRSSLPLVQHPLRQQSHVPQAGAPASPLTTPFGRPYRWFSTSPVAQATWSLPPHRSLTLAMLPGSAPPPVAQATWSLPLQVLRDTEFFKLTPSRHSFSEPGLALLRGWQQLFLSFAFSVPPCPDAQGLEARPVSPFCAIITTQTQEGGTYGIS